MSEHHDVIIVGAGPGGIAVAAALQAHGVKDVLLLEKGVVGQAWLDYPANTHLLSESAPDKDDNKIADVDTADVFPHIPHPSHILYQKYLEHVIHQKKIPVCEKTFVEKVSFDAAKKLFHLVTDRAEYTAKFLVWAAGMYTTPNEMTNCEGCYVHYAKVPDLSHIIASEVTVVGSANGASGVVMQLAQPGRVVTMVVSHEYVVPQPIDCLWKEHMQFIQDLEKQGLVRIVEKFRVADIVREGSHYILKSEDGQELTSPNKPIMCIGFHPNVAPVQDMLETYELHHETFMSLHPTHESKKQPGLYVAGCIGKVEPSEGMIVVFREFGEPIAADIVRKLQ